MIISPHPSVSSSPSAIASKTVFFFCPSDCCTNARKFRPLQLPLPFSHTPQPPPHHQPHHPSLASSSTHTIIANLNRSSSAHTAWIDSKAMDRGNDADRSTSSSDHALDASGIRNGQHMQDGHGSDVTTAASINIVSKKVTSHDDGNNNRVGLSSVNGTAAGTTTGQFQDDATGPLKDDDAKKRHLLPASSKSFELEPDFANNRNASLAPWASPASSPAKPPHHQDNRDSAKQQQQHHAQQHLSSAVTPPLASLHSLTSTTLASASTNSSSSVSNEPRQ
ncbi:hypothetical protein BC829DRAFT_297223 [Chytridium lagenaria]|nr:hypothetical protein BC829DRAFT_297223 [Chytridium lagenaria]